MDRAVIIEELKFAKKQAVEARENDKLAAQWALDRVQNHERDMQKALAESEARVRAKVTAISKEKITALQETLDALRGERMANGEALADALEELQVHRSRAKDFEDKLAMADGELNSTERGLDEAHEERSALEVENRKLQAQLAEMTARAEEAEAALEQERDRSMQARRKSEADAARAIAEVRAEAAREVAAAEEQGQAIEREKKATAVGAALSSAVNKARAADEVRAAELAAQEAEAAQHAAGLAAAFSSAAIKSKAAQEVRAAEVAAEEVAAAAEAAAAAAVARAHAAPTEMSTRLDPAHTQSSSETQGQLRVASPCPVVVKLPVSIPALHSPGAFESIADTDSRAPGAQRLESPTGERLSLVDRATLSVGFAVDAAVERAIAAEREAGAERTDDALMEMAMQHSREIARTVRIATAASFWQTISAKIQAAKVMSAGIPVTAIRTSRRGSLIDRYAVAEEGIIQGHNNDSTVGHGGWSSDDFDHNHSYTHHEHEHDSEGVSVYVKPVKAPTTPAAPVSPATPATPATTVSVAAEDHRLAVEAARKANDEAVAAEAKGEVARDAQRAAAKLFEAATTDEERASAAEVVRRANEDYEIIMAASEQARVHLEATEATAALAWQRAQKAESNAAVAKMSAQGATEAVQVEPADTSAGTSDAGSLAAKPSGSEPAKKKGWALGRNSFVIAKPAGGSNEGGGAVAVKSSSIAGVAMQKAKEAHDPQVLLKRIKKLEKELRLAEKKMLMHKASEEMSRMMRIADLEKLKEDHEAETLRERTELKRTKHALDNSQLMVRRLVAKSNEAHMLLFFIAQRGYKLITPPPPPPELTAKEALAKEKADRKEERKMAKMSNADKARYKKEKAEAAGKQKRTGRELRKIFQDNVKLVMKCNRHHQLDMAEALDDPSRAMDAFQGMLHTQMFFGAQEKLLLKVQKMLVRLEATSSRLRKRTEQCDDLLQQSNRERKEDVRVRVALQLKVEKFTTETLPELHAEVAILQEKLAVSNGDNQRLNTELSELSDHLHSMVSERRTLVSSNQELSVDVERLSDELKTSTEKLEEMTKAHTEMMDEIRNASAGLEGMGMDFGPPPDPFKADLGPEPGAGGGSGRRRAEDNRSASSMRDPGDGGTAESSRRGSPKRGRAKSPRRSTTNHGRSRSPLAGGRGGSPSGSGCEETPTRRASVTSPGGANGAGRKARPSVHASARTGHVVAAESTKEGGGESPGLNRPLDDPLVGRIRPDQQLKSGATTDSKIRVSVETKHPAGSWAELVNPTPTVVTREAELPKRVSQRPLLGCYAAPTTTSYKTRTTNALAPPQAPRSPSPDGGEKHSHGHRHVLQGGHRPATGSPPRATGKKGTTAGKAAVENPMAKQMRHLKTLMQELQAIRREAKGHKKENHINLQKIANLKAKNKQMKRAVVDGFRDSSRLHGIETRTIGTQVACVVCATHDDIDHEKLTRPLMQHAVSTATLSAKVQMGSAMGGPGRVRAGDLGRQPHYAPQEPPHDPRVTGGERVQPQPGRGVRPGSAPARRRNAGSGLERGRRN